MDLTISQARRQLGRLCTLAQDSRLPIVLTRHGRPIAAIVSIAEVQRIWDLSDTERQGWWSPLFRMRRSPGLMRMVPAMEIGRDGNFVTPREAAQQVRELQLTRAEERRVLKAGGLEPVADGELAIDTPPRAGFLTRIKARWGRKG